jgi:hypothetical protein
LRIIFWNFQSNNSFAAGVNKGTKLSISYFQVESGQTFSQLGTAHEAGKLSQKLGVMVEGGILQITVTDSDLDTNQSSIFSIPDRFILVTTSKDSEKERVPLTKSTSSTPGMFVGLLQTFPSHERGKDFSGTMNAVAGDYLTVQYFDEAPIGSDVMYVRVAMRGQVSHSPYLAGIGTPITITVLDLDLNLNGSAAEVTSVKIQKQPSMPGENLDIYIDALETGVGTGTFTASFTPVFGIPVAGQLGFCDASDVVTATYLDK